MLVIVEREPLAHLASRISHNGIGVSVIVRWSMKDLDSESTFLQKVGIAGQRGLNDIPEQRRIALAVAEVWTCQNLLQRDKNLLAVMTGLGMPRLPCCLNSTHNDLRDNTTLTD
jgi:hypothetical protein